MVKQGAFSPLLLFQSYVREYRMLGSIFRTVTVLDKVRQMSRMTTVNLLKLAYFKHPYDKERIITDIVEECRELYTEPGIDSVQPNIYVEWSKCSDRYSLLKLYSVYIRSTTHQSYEILLHQLMQDQSRIQGVLKQFSNLLVQPDFNPQTVRDILRQYLADVESKEHVDGSVQR